MIRATRSKGSLRSFASLIWFDRAHVAYYLAYQKGHWTEEKALRGSQGAAAGGIFHPGVAQFTPGELLELGGKNSISKG